MISLIELKGLTTLKFNYFFLKKYFDLLNVTHQILRVGQTHKHLNFIFWHSLSRATMSIFYEELRRGITGMFNGHLKLIDHSK